MKNYFQFRLTGKQLFPVWLVLIIFFLIPYILVLVKIETLQQAIDTGFAYHYFETLLFWYAFLFALIIICYSIVFYLIKPIIENTGYKDTFLTFTGSLGEYLKILITGMLLTIITFGIYSPWFITRMIRFFSSKTACEENKFEFKGEGSNLFVIILFCLIIPIMVIAFLSGIFAFIAGDFMLQGNMFFDYPLATLSGTALIIAILSLIAFLLIAIPYMYYTYKWFVNFKIKNYHIQWKTDFWDAFGKIAVEILLCIITFGIYTPLAILKLYQYFAEHTVATSETATKRFGYDLDAGSDFLFLWGQSLLSIITLGIYYPWAFCKISKRVLEKSFVEEEREIASE